MTNLIDLSARFDRVKRDRERREAIRKALSDLLLSSAWNNLWETPGIRPAYGFLKKALAALDVPDGKVPSPTADPGAPKSA